MKRDETKDRFGRPGREVPEPIEPSSIEREREKMLMVARKHSSYEEEVGKEASKKLRYFGIVSKKNCFIHFFLVKSVLNFCRLLVRLNEWTVSAKILVIFSKTSR